MSGLSTRFLLAVRNLVGIHVQHRSRGRKYGFCPSHAFTVDPRSGREVPPPASPSVSKDWNRAVSATLSDLLRVDQPEGGILAQPLGVLDLLVTGQRAVEGLAKQIRQRKTGCSCGGVGRANAVR